MDDGVQIPFGICVNLVFWQQAATDWTQYPFDSDVEYLLLEKNIFRWLITHIKETKEAMNLEKGSDVSQAH